MKLLLDNNLSVRLVKRLVDLFPEINHVKQHGLRDADDSVIWDFAKDNGFSILTKDSDYDHLLSLSGHPPKIIWIRTGNCKVGKIEAILRENFEELNEFVTSQDLGILIIEK